MWDPDSKPCAKENKSCMSLFDQINKQCKLCHTQNSYNEISDSLEIVPFSFWIWSGPWDCVWVQPDSMILNCPFGFQVLVAIYPDQLSISFPGLWLGPILHVLFMTIYFLSIFSENCIIHAGTSLLRKKKKLHNCAELQVRVERLWLILESTYRSSFRIGQNIILRVAIKKNSSSLGALCKSNPKDWKVARLIYIFHVFIHYSFMALKLAEIKAQ